MENQESLKLKLMTMKSKLMDKNQEESVEVENKINYEISTNEKEVKDVLVQEDVNIDKNLKEILKAEFDLLEVRLFKGLRNDVMHRFQDNIISQIRHLQIKQNEIDAKINKLVAATCGEIDEKEEARRAEIKQQVLRLQELLKEAE